MPLSKRARAEFERQLAAALGEAWDGLAGEVLDLLGNPPDLTRLPPEFWAALAAGSTAAVLPILISARAASAERLARSVGVINAVNWDLANERAAAAAERYAFNLVRGITDTTRETLQRQVSNFFSAPKQDLQALGAEIGKTFGPVRGEMIATTEVTRAAAQGEQDLVGEIRRLDPGASVVEVWQTSNDELVCPVCAPLNGVRRGPNGFEHPDGSTYDGPPAHPRCLPGDTRVSAAGISAATKRWYDGDLIIVRTAGGNRLACTPNHPILTPGGWVAAGLLNKSGHVISSNRAEWRSLINSNNQNMPARIEDITEAFRSSEHVASAPVPVSPEDFHGDGMGSKVAVVWANCFLNNRSYPALDKHLPQIALGVRDMQLFGLNSKRVFDFGLEVDWFPTRSRVSRRNLSGAFDLRHLCPLHALGFALISNLYPGLYKSISDYIAFDPELFRDGILGNSGAVQLDDALNGNLDSWLASAATSVPNNIDAGSFESTRDDVSRDSQLAADLIAGLSGPVFTDEIIDIERVTFHGFVFNLETESGSYVSEGIVTHNCRCALSTQLVTILEE